MLLKVLFRKRVFFVLSAVIVIIVMGKMMINNHQSSRPPPWWKSAAPCNYPLEIEKDMYDMLNKLHNLFVELKVKHFICYGTLWGAIRYSKLLPFDRDVDLCVVYDDQLSALQQHDLLQKVKAKFPDFYVVYDPNENIYNIYLNRAMGELVFFRREGDRFVRALSRIEGIDMTDSFPAHLLDDMTNMNVGNLKLPAPDSSIMRYFYPDTYMFEKKPPNCF